MTICLGNLTWSTQTLTQELQMWHVAHHGAHCVLWECSLPYARPRRQVRACSFSAPRDWDGKGLLAFDWCDNATFPSMNYIWSLNLVKYFINVNYREWIPTFLIVNFLGSHITTLMFITAWLWLDNAVLKECVLRS